jgi:hypothetical protein
VRLISSICEKSIPDSIACVNRRELGVNEAFTLGCFTNVFKKMRKMKCSIDNKGYVVVKLSTGGESKTHKVHRLIAKTFLQDYSEDLEVDHIDRCKTNNRLDNLRMVNRSQNMQNKLCKGYSWNKSSQKWKAMIMINHKAISLGRYDTEEEAREAYLRGKQKYHTH